MASPTDFMYHPLFQGNPEQGGGPSDIATPAVGIPDASAPITTLPDKITNSSGGFSGVMDFISKLFPGSSDGSGFGGINPNMIPFLTTAINQYNNSGKYMDMATKYADQMDPFGKQRAYYQDRLRQLTEDPNKYLTSSPDYQASLKQGLSALDSSLSAKGFAGSGHAADEAQSFGSMLASQYLDKDRQSLMQMAGSNIGPAAAAALISQGMKGSIDSQNQALSDLFAAFTKPKTNAGPGTGGTPPPGGGPGISDIIKQGGDWTKILQSSKTPVSDLFKYFMSKGMSQSDALQQITRMGLSPEDAFSRDSGGYAPGEPGYDTGGSTPYPYNPYPDDGSGGYGPQPDFGTTPDLGMGPPEAPWVGSGDMDIPTIDWSSTGGGFDMGMFFD